MADLVDEEAKCREISMGFYDLVGDGAQATGHHYRCLTMESREASNTKDGTSGAGTTSGRELVKRWWGGIKRDLMENHLI